MHGTFTLKIELGNEAMSNAADVARALRRVAGRMDEGASDGRIMDPNGNAVGVFSLERDRVGK